MNTKAKGTRNEHRSMNVPKERLTPKQGRFVEEYLIDYNATQAAIRAGYSPKTAYSLGQENLKKPEISQEIEKRRQRVAEKAELRHVEVLNELKLLAFSSIDNYKIDDFGQVTVAEGVPPEAIRSVSAIRRKATHRKNGDVVYDTELKLWNKPYAIDLAGKHLGIWEAKEPAQPVNQFFMNAPSPLLRELAAKIRARMKEEPTIEAEYKEAECQQIEEGRAPCGHVVASQHTA